MAAGLEAYALAHLGQHGVGNLAGTGLAGF
jgi:hypothetical protein